MAATAPQSMSTVEHTDAAFTAHTPALTSTEPAVVPALRARGRFRPPAAARPHVARHDPPPPVRSSPSLNSRSPAGQDLRAGYRRWSLLMAIRRRPQGDVGWSARMDLERRDDLMVRFLNSDQLAELVRFDLAFPDRFGVRFEHAQNFVGDVRMSPPRDTRARLRDDTLHERPHLLQLLLGALQDRLDLRMGRAHALAQAPHHRRRVPQHGSGSWSSACDNSSPTHPGSWAIVLGTQWSARAGSSTPQSMANPTGRIAQHGYSHRLHGAREHAHPIPQQGSLSVG